MTPIVNITSTPIGENGRHLVQVRIGHLFRNRDIRADATDERKQIDEMIVAMCREIVANGSIYVQPHTKLWSGG